MVGRRSQVKNPKEGMAQFAMRSCGTSTIACLRYKRIGGAGILTKDSKRSRHSSYENQKKKPGDVGLHAHLRDLLGEGSRGCAADFDKESTNLRIEVGDVSDCLHPAEPAGQLRSSITLNVVSAPKRWQTSSFPHRRRKTEALPGPVRLTMGLRACKGTVAGRVGGEGVAVLIEYTLRLSRFNSSSVPRRSFVPAVKSSQALRTRRQSLGKDGRLESAYGWTQHGTPTATDDAVERLSKTVAIN